jgi:hypothetical protein
VAAWSGPSITKPPLERNDDTLSTLPELIHFPAQCCQDHKRDDRFGRPRFMKQHDHVPLI